MLFISVYFSLNNFFCIFLTSHQKDGYNLPIDSKFYNLFRSKKNKIDQDCSDLIKFENIFQCDRTLTCLGNNRVKALLFRPKQIAPFLFLEKKETKQKNDPSVNRLNTV